MSGPETPRGKQSREYQGIETGSIYVRTQRRGYEAAKALYVHFTSLPWEIALALIWLENRAAADLP